MEINKIFMLLFACNILACSESSPKLDAEYLTGEYLSNINDDETITIQSDLTFIHHFKSEGGGVISNVGNLHVYDDMLDSGIVGFNGFCPKYICDKGAVKERKGTTSFEVYRDGNSFKLCHQVGSDDVNCFVKKK